MSFKTQIETDLTAVFFNTDEFGDEAVWTWIESAGPPAVTDSKDITGIFDKTYNAVDINGEPIEGAVTMFTTGTDQVEGVAHGDTLTIGSDTYYIIGIQPDGTGVTVLILSEDEA